MEVSLSVVASGTPDALRSVGNVVLYGNGIEIATGAPALQETTSGYLQSISYSFDWMVDASQIAKSDGTVRLNVVAPLNVTPSGTQSLPVVSSNELRVIIKRSRVREVLLRFSQQ